MKKYITPLVIAISTLFTSCVQEEHEKTVKLFVDTNGIENVQSIGIRGDFLPNQWRETVPMTDENKDGIYEISFTRETAAYGIEFKFVKNDNEFELKGQDNREIVFEYKPETIEYRTTFNDTKNTTIKRN